MLFFDLVLSLLLGTTLKVFFADVGDEIATSMEINFLHKIKCTTSTSCLLWD